MISDHRSISVKDMGAGSVKLKTKIRKVSDIARYSPIPRKYGVFLSNMAAEFGGPLILEFGTSIGISTMYMAASCPGTIVKTVEGCSEISEVAKENFKNAEINNIEVFEGSFDDALSGIINDKITPGLVFIDGNHRKEPVIDYFNQIAQMSDSKTVIIIDDIYYSREMEQAWNEIKKDKRVSLTVDIFRMGIIFFRKGIKPGNFSVRY